jgi:hypothetical protein
MAESTRNRTRSPEEIERDIQAERQQLHDTIDEALNRFTFEEAWNRAGGYLKENRSEFGQSFGRVLRERPMGVMLTAIGLAWLFFGPKETAKSRSLPRRRTDSDLDTTGRAYDLGRVSDRQPAAAGPVMQSGDVAPGIPETVPTKQSVSEPSPTATELSSPNEGPAAERVPPTKAQSSSKSLEGRPPGSPLATGTGMATDPAGDTENPSRTSPAIPREDEKR